MSRPRRTDHFLGHIPFVLAASVSVLSCASTRASPEYPHGHDAIVDVPYCSLISHPGDFDGHTIRTTATWTVGFEVSVLKGAGCSGRSDWTWTERTSDFEQNTNPRVLHRFKTLSERRSVRVTIVGIFHGPRTHLVGIGRQGRLGYGHLNAYDYQMDVLAIESAASAGWLSRH